MRENIELFNQMLTKFKFTEPVPREMQQHIRKIKQKQFNNTLKKTGKYSLAFALVAYLFFILKKAGINITIMKSAAVLALSSSVAAVAVGTCVYHAVKIIIHKTGTRIEQKIEYKKESKEESGDKLINTIEADKLKKAAFPETGDTKTKAGFIKRGIGIQEFSGLNIKTSAAEKVTDAVSDELGRLRGRDLAVDFRKASDKKTDLVLRGSVEFLGGSYKITAKVIDVATLKILYYTAESVDSQDKLEDASRKIARKIAEME